MGKIPITVLNGYLGSGKTTFLNHLLQNQDGLKIAVIVNDLGEVNVDAKLIDSAGILESGDAKMIELSNGCICCSLRSDLMMGIEEIIKSKRFDYIVIESSGVTEPIPVAQTMILGQTTDGIPLSDLCYVDAMVTVVDALRLKDEFALGHELIHAQTEDNHEHHHHEHGEESIAGLLVDQLEFCNIVILNKIDLVSKVELATIKSYVKKIQPTAKLIETFYGRVDFNDILNKKSFNLDEVVQGTGWVQALLNPHMDHNHAAEYGISSFVYRRRRPFDAGRLAHFFEDLGQTVIRTKGIIWLSSSFDTAFMLSQAGGNISFDEFGTWLATKDKTTIEKLLASDARIRSDWDDSIGDRMNEIVVIGFKMDKSRVMKQLDNALVDEKEFAYLQKLYKNP